MTRTSQSIATAQSFRAAFLCAVLAGMLLLTLGGVALAQSGSQADSDASHQMYLELVRRADAFAGKPLSFAGQVIQSIPGTQSNALRINVTPGKYNSWRDTIYVEYKPEAAGQTRIAEGALVSVRGTFTGTKSYQSVIGDTITVPSVVACLIRPAVENIAACPGETPAASAGN
jgi:hypothetical protein